MLARHKAGRYRVAKPLSSAGIERLIKNANNINFIDAARSERIVVSFATPGAQKAVRQDQNRARPQKRKGGGGSEESGSE